MHMHITLHIASNRKEEEEEEEAMKKMQSKCSTVLCFAVVQCSAIQCCDHD